MMLAMGYAVQRFAIALIFLAAAVAAFRFAAADWWLQSGTPAALARSAGWWRARSEPHARLAAVDPEREALHLERALEREPRASSLLIAGAMVAEFSGRSPEARRLLGRAMEVDHGFRPVWAWLGFVARQGTPAEFWPQAKAAFEMSYGDRSALFDLCWSVRPEARFLWREVVSRQAPVLFDFVQFLMRQGELSTAREAYASLLEQPYGSISRANAGRVATRDERSHLGLDLCDLLLDRRQPEAAAEVWSRMEAKGLAGRRAGGRCLDLRMLPEPDGVHFSRGEAGWTFEFSGRQRDDLELLWRPAAGRAVLAMPVPDSRLAWQRREVKGAWRDVLAYHRESGELPLRGTIVIGRPEGSAAQ